jgi:hypothetical protein
VAAALVSLVALVVALVLTTPFSGSGETQGSTEGSDAGTAAAVVPDRDPTPFFASYRSLRLSLPVEPGAVTALAFHQAAGDSALHLQSLVPDADMGALTGEAPEAEPGTSTQGGSGHIWTGEALRLWRTNRSGLPDSAVDVGAAPGTEVRAPVSGTVVRVRRYELYGEHEDYEIHIEPEGWPEVDLVLIHIADVRVAAGDTVVGGVTGVATVRHLSDKVELQLGDYDTGDGDHVHMQLNKVAVPGVLEAVPES